MEPDPVVVELQAIAAKLDTLNALMSAHHAAEVTWFAQMLFLSQAQAIALGILWGCFSWLLICVAKNQRNPIW